LGFLAFQGSAGRWITLKPLETSWVTLCGFCKGWAPRRRLLLEEAEFFGVVAAEEQVEEGVGGGAPILPALRPVGAAAIAGVLAEDGDGAGLFLARLGVIDELGAALRGGRRTVWGGLCGLVGWIHLKAGLERK
jgi:hypothetical protein